MAVDLTITTALSRTSLLLDGGDLLILSHQTGRDRIRRMGLERVHCLICWRTMPWGRMLLLSAFLFLVYLVLMLAIADPFRGGMSLAVVSTEGLVIGFFTLLLVLAICAWYAFTGKTHLAIQRAGEQVLLKGIILPGKVTRFIDRFDRQVRMVQERAAREGMEAEFASDPLLSIEEELSGLAMAEEADDTGWRGAADLTEAGIEETAGQSPVGEEDTDKDRSESADDGPWPRPQ